MHLAVNISSSLRYLQIKHCLPVGADAGNCCESNPNYGTAVPAVYHRL
jgi:hypothetical protein